MPVLEDVKSSWADEVELEGGTLPPPTEVYDNDLKIVTEYKLNEDGKRVKYVCTYKIEKRNVSKSVALRKTWKKFGESADDKPGPNPATTIVAEDVYMQYITSKEEDNKQMDDDSMEKLRAMGNQTLVKCRTCGGDHWSLRCPYKHMAGFTGKLTNATEDGRTAAAGTAGAAGGATTKFEPGKPGATTTSSATAGSTYVPPGRREGAANKRTDTFGTRRDDTSAIRITNLSESTNEQDLEDLVKHFGPISKIFLAKDKQGGVCKGFAYVHYRFRHDAAKAIQTLNGHGYDHLILSVDWSKPHNPA